MKSQKLLGRILGNSSACPAITGAVLLLSMPAAIASTSATAPMIRHSVDVGDPHGASVFANSAQNATSLNLSPAVIEQSPVLQRWLESVPDVHSDIRNDPSFTTRLQAGYSVFPSSGGTGGFSLAVDDWFVGRSAWTLSADYQQNFRGDRQAYGADMHYYLLPLGSYFNLAPTLGYRFAKSASDYSISGANVGLRLRFVPSRTGAADVTFDQSWVFGDSERLSITQLNVGYAITQNLRLSTDIEWQSTADEGDSRVGLNLEWSL